jgi:hypothetical protein
VGSPYINHFLQPDSLIPDPSNPQALNRFSYVGNRPINFNDPSGHNEECGIGESGCSAGTYTPPPDQSGSLDRVLKKYGITTEGGSRKQKYAALFGANLVGNRYTTVYGGTAADNFYKVHGDIHIVFGADRDDCKTDGGTITCGAEDKDNYWLQTLIHEYGHVFDIRYQSLSHWDDAACDTSKGGCLASSYLPGEFYGTDGYFGDSPPSLAHAPSVRGYDYSEAFADMYMNWVLDRQGYEQNGFDLQSNMGQDRYNWMQYTGPYTQPSGISTFLVLMGLLKLR